MTKIVVGVDGSESSQAALQWAAAEAALHDQPLVALMAWGYLDQHHVPVSSRTFEPDYDEAHARDALGQYVTDALGPDGSDGVERRPVCDLPARALVEAGNDAGLLVVGARGRGGFARLLLGSVSQKVLHQATCPVAVIRAGQDVGARRGEGRIVVGIDGSPNADAALGWAIDEGRRRDAGVEVVHAWHLPFVSPYPSIAADFDSSAFETMAHETIDQAIGRATLTADDRITQVTSASGAAPLVLETAKGADLIVVGSRGLSGATATLLGSVSHQVTLHATCPVVVIPKDADMTQIDRNGLEVLNRADCIRLLGTVSLGRIGITVGALPTILPINFRVDGDRILFRTGIGTKLDAATRGAVVAFEADDIDPMYHSGWSVVVTGVAREVDDPDDLAISTTPRWAPSQTERLVEVSIDEMSGRRLDGFQLQSGWSLHDSG